MNQRDIARLAGVSSATVSRVINNDSRVSPETAAHVWSVIREHGYVQNSIARSLRTSRTMTIGFLVPDIANPFFPAVLRGIETFCSENRYNLILQNTSEDEMQEARAVDILLRSRVEGVIAIPTDSSGIQLDSLRSMNVPVVLVDRKVSVHKYDCVLIDNTGGIEQAVQYLADLGHRRIAMLHGTKTITPGEERLQGFVQGMTRAGLSVFPPYVVDGKFTEDAGYRRVVELMSLTTPPTAIISANNLMTIGAYRALVDLDVGIPETISLIGFDDFPLATYLSPPITVINRPTADMGKHACDLLFKRIDGVGQSEPQIIRMPTHLEIRGSCAPVAACS